VGEGMTAIVFWSLMIGVFFAIATSDHTNPMAKICGVFSTLFFSLSFAGFCVIFLKSDIGPRAGAKP
jgi:hypothetical protein